jgi:UDP-N-acetylglucosamine transferase subunit ALG13
MIFVTVGSSRIPFDRLLRAVDAAGLDEPLVVQHGASAVRPYAAECVDYLDHGRFVELVRDARVVVTHAGVGSIMTALGEGKRPVVVPRRSSHDEAVDDHQVPFARRAGELGLVTLVEDVEELARAIAAETGVGAGLESGASPIELELRAYIEEWVGTGEVVMSEGSRQWA